MREAAASCGPVFEFIFTFARASYEHSTICTEAMLCGCPVVYLPNKILLVDPPGDYLTKDGYAWGASDEQIRHAKQTVSKVYDHYSGMEKIFWQQLDDFIRITPEAAARVCS